jgi:hypothetical protein
MNEIYLDNSKNEITTPELLSTERNNYKDWHCWAGVEQLVIDSFGEIYNAWCKESRIGNIKDEVLQFPRDPVICKSSYCHCQLDLSMTKQRMWDNKNCESNEENRLEQLNLPLNGIDWTLSSDTDSSGNSVAQIGDLKELELKIKLIVKASTASHIYALVSLPWVYNDHAFKGIMLKMDLERGKIITIQIPLKTNEDSDFYHTQIIGEGNTTYYIYFKDLMQQGYGKPAKWDQKEIIELQFLNEFTKNDINVTFKKFALLY